MPMTEWGRDPGWSGLAPEAKDRGKVGPRDHSPPRMNPHPHTLGLPEFCLGLIQLLIHLANIH